MKNLIKRTPIPMAGLMLALAATGNLVLSYGNSYRNAFGILSAALLLLLIAKLVTEPGALKEGFDNPVVASVTPTLTMGAMLLSTYIKPYTASLAYGVWAFALGMHAILIILFTQKYILRFNIKKVFPSYFVVYVGIVVGSVTAPAYGHANWGQAIFWFGLITYLLLLPIVLYRVLKIKEIPEAALPTITIFAAPASLLVVGYLNSFQEKNIVILGVLALMALISLAAVLFYLPKLLKLRFYPSYSAFTFPLVISGIAIKGTNAFLKGSDRGIVALGYLVRPLEAFAVIIVLYVLFRYIMFLMPTSPAAASHKNAKPSVK